VTVVQTSGSGERAGRVAAVDGRPQPIVHRGLVGGGPVGRTAHPTSHVRGVSSALDLSEIERQDGLVVPWTHPAVKLVNDLKVTERLKLFLLNLAHTCMADRWRADGRREDETVRELVADPDIRAWLDALYDEELLPVFAAAGVAEAPEYRRSVIDRFRNPFLDHRLSDIVMNHADKKERRVGGFIAWAGEVAPDLPLSRLRAVTASGIG
jgi:tagaturonate reductase